MPLTEQQARDRAKTARTEAGAKHVEAENFDRLAELKQLGAYLLSRPPGGRVVAVFDVRSGSSRSGAAANVAASSLRVLVDGLISDLEAELGV